MEGSVIEAEPAGALPAPAANWTPPTINAGTPPRQPDAPKPPPPAPPPAEPEEPEPPPHPGPDGGPPPAEPDQQLGVAASDHVMPRQIGHDPQPEEWQE